MRSFDRRLFQNEQLKTADPQTKAADWKKKPLYTICWNSWTYRLHGQTTNQPLPWMPAKKSLRRWKPRSARTCFSATGSKNQFYLLLMPGDKPFTPKRSPASWGCARLSFAKEEALEQLLHLTPGSATIFGLMYDTENQVQLVVDQELLREPYFGCHPCINTSTSGCRPAMSLTS